MTIYMDIHKVSSIEVEGMTQQIESGSYINCITIKTEDGQKLELTVLSDNKEAIKGYFR